MNKPEVTTATAPAPVITLPVTRTPASMVPPAVQNPNGATAVTLAPEVLQADIIIREGFATYKGARISLIETLKQGIALYRKAELSNKLICEHIRDAMNASNAYPNKETVSSTLCQLKKELGLAAERAAGAGRKPHKLTAEERATVKAIVELLANAGHKVSANQQDTYKALKALGIFED